MLPYSVSCTRPQAFILICSSYPNMLEEPFGTFISHLGVEKIRLVYVFRVFWRACVYVPLNGLANNVADSRIATNERDATLSKPSNGLSRGKGCGLTCPMLCPHMHAMIPIR